MPLTLLFGTANSWVLTKFIKTGCFNETEPANDFFLFCIVIELPSQLSSNKLPAKDINGIFFQLLFAVSHNIL